MLSPPSQENLAEEQKSENEDKKLEVDRWGKVCDDSSAVSEDTQQDTKRR